jgi:hypothetical protein
VHRDLRYFLSVTGPGKGLQCSASCFLLEEDVHALLKVAVHKCNRGGVACCRNRSEVGHMLAELGDEVCRIHWVGSRS